MTATQNVCHLGHHAENDELCKIQNKAWHQHLYTGIMKIDVDNDNWVSLNSVEPIDTAFGVLLNKAPAYKNNG